ncbi:ABC transporter permease [Desulfogranum marinum]|uniref:ABC transporter permease n=1 Tax=Desulfogranum marinum TaxID=453220 RepID=UPI0019666533|nr:ABC transporter permease subunit [Desulfogranum marinum]MBM9513575.1 hypothetical protein [Desulfogranum marinum]
MNKLWSVAFLTFKEGLKHRILYCVFIVALLAMTLSVLISGFFMRDISKIILDFCLATISIGGLLVPFFLGITLLAGDIDKRTVVTILSRDISRPQYILGKYIGISLLTGMIMAFFFAATIIAIQGGILLYGEHYFKSYSLLAVFSSTLLNYFGISILNAVVVLWCSITTTSFLATLLTLATYLVGHLMDDVVRFIESPPPGILISMPLQKTVQATQYIFPNLAAFDHKLSAAHGIPIPFIQFSVLTSYAGVYIVAVLSLSIVLFTRRDLC